MSQEFTWITQIVIKYRKWQHGAKVYDTLISTLHNNLIVYLCSGISYIGKQASLYRNKPSCLHKEVVMCKRASWKFTHMIYHPWVTNIFDHEPRSLRAYKAGKWLAWLTGVKKYWQHLKCHGAILDICHVLYFCHDEVLANLLQSRVLTLQYQCCIYTGHEFDHHCACRWPNTYGIRPSAGTMMTTKLKLIF